MKTYPCNPEKTIRREKMQNSRELTIQATIRKMHAGDLTALKLVEFCLARIHARDDTLFRVRKCPWI